MRPTDTHPKVQRMLDEHWVQMTPAEKGAAVRQHWVTYERLQLVGLRRTFPDESEELLRERMIERRLGPELYARVRSWIAERG